LLPPRWRGLNHKSLLQNEKQLSPWCNTNIDGYGSRLALGQCSLGRDDIKRHA
jgi:hypothetical protein